MYFLTQGSEVEGDWEIAGLRLHFLQPVGVTHPGFVVSSGGSQLLLAWAKKECSSGLVVTLGDQ